MKFSFCEWTKLTYFGLKQELGHKWWFQITGSVTWERWTLSWWKFLIKIHRNDRFYIVFVLTIWMRKDAIPRRRVGLLKRSSRYLTRKEKSNKFRTNRSSELFRSLCDQQTHTHFIGTQDVEPVEDGEKDLGHEHHRQNVGDAKQSKYGSKAVHLQWRGLINSNDFPTTYKKVHSLV